MAAKTFTLKEANKAIPRLEKIFNEIFVLRKKISIMKSEADWLVEFWGSALHDTDNPDEERFDMLVVEMEYLHGDVVKKIAKAEGMGCVVKDIDNGLVDFHSMINGRPGLLCWRHGEKEISFWHDSEAGYGKRMPLTSMDRTGK